MTGCRSFWRVGLAFLLLVILGLLFQQQQTAQAFTTTKTPTVVQQQLISTRGHGRYNTGSTGSGGYSSTQLYNFLDDIFRGGDPMLNNNNNNNNNINNNNNNNILDLENNNNNNVMPPPQVNGVMKVAVDGTSTTTSSSSSSQAEINAIQTELFDQSEVLIGLEVARDELKSVLTKKQAQLEQQQDVWSQEKTGFVAQLAELTATLAQFKDDNQADDDVQKEMFSEYQMEQERLQREIRLLQNQQSQVEKRLAVERERNEALQTKLSKANDSLEFEQMLFFKQRKELEAQLDEQQKQLTDLERNLSKEQNQFDTDQTTLQTQLEAQKDQLASSRQDLKQLQRQYYEGQDVMKEQLRQEERAAKEAQRALQQERRQQQRERDQLEKFINKEQKNLVNLEQSIVEETQQFMEVTKPDLEQTFEQEQFKVEQLSRKIQREQDRFDLEKTTLEERIAAEKKRLGLVQDQLSRERTENNQILEDLSYEQTLIEEQRQEDRARMGKRYAALRAAINARIEQEKRQGRQDLRILQVKYQSTLDDTQGVINDLQDQVDMTITSNNNLQGMVDNIKAQVDQINTEQKESEVRYQRLVMDRKIEIKSLETDLEQLQEEELYLQDDIERVEHTYREIAKASLELTGRRLNRVNPLRLIKRSRNNKRRKGGQNNNNNNNKK